MNRWFVLFLAVVVPSSGSGDVGGSPPPGEGVSAYQRYHYTLEGGKDGKVCHHMSRVYNDAFKQPWSYFTHTHPPPWFPVFLLGQEQPKLRSGLFSRFPESKEFSAIDWREGVMLDPIATSTVLIAKFDIDNDGTEDLVLKRPNMDPWQQGAEDALVVLDLGQLDVTKPIDPKDVYFRSKGLRRPAFVSYKTLGFMGAWVRPFIHEGITYLSVHESGQPQTMWVLKFNVGGGRTGKIPPGVEGSWRIDLAHPWDPLEFERVCRFTMGSVK